MPSLETCSGRNKSSLGGRGSWALWHLQSPEELLLQGWSLGWSCAAPNQSTTEPQGDVASPARCELLLRGSVGPPLTHRSEHQTLSALMWELSSWETSPFDVPAGLQQARAELQSLSFNYRDFTAAESLGGVDHLHCGSSRKQDLSLQLLMLPPSHKVLVPTLLLLPPTPQNPFLPRPQQAQVCNSLTLFSLYLFA